MIQISQQQLKLKNEITRDVILVRLYNEIYFIQIVCSYSYSYQVIFTVQVQR